jgi:hypothetical protein
MITSEYRITISRKGSLLSGQGGFKRIGINLEKSQLDSLVDFALKIIARHILDELFIFWL